MEPEPAVRSDVAPDAVAKPGAEQASTRAAARQARLASFFAPALASTRYVALRELGRGAYGVVVAARDRCSGGKVVAVKRIRGCLRTYPMATRTLRELKVLRLLQGHENIIRVEDVLLPGGEKEGLWGFDDTFVVFELMPADLGRMIRSSTEVSEHHVKFFMFQLLRGVHYMHSCNVLHRDLKPSNILINQACELRICDFGLARAAFGAEADTLFWTDYVATRWYRAPELIMEDHTMYSTAIDMWSVGCIFAELLSGGRVLFPGTVGEEQFQLITAILGSPPSQFIARMRNPAARRLLTQLASPPRAGSGLRASFPNVPDDAMDLLEKLLVFDQDSRISALDALCLPYFSSYRHLGLGSAVATPLPQEEFEFEQGRLSPAEMRSEFLREILTYHPEHREAVLAEFHGGAGAGVRRAGGAEVFGAGMDAALRSRGSDAPTSRSMTLQEQHLHEVNGPVDDGRGGGGRGGGYRISARQHVTMSETELGQFTRQ